ncbi:hypothetical protein ACFOG5_24810 [Pedobacter fastidiosus]
MATLVEVSGAKYPLTFKGNKIFPMEGKSLLPIIRGYDVPIHDKPIFLGT